MAQASERLYTSTTPSCHLAGMRAIQILVAAIILGLAGGYAWSALAPRTSHVPIPKAVYKAPPDPPESRSDKEWAARAEQKSAPELAASGPDPTLVEQSVYYGSCSDARAAGKTVIREGEPGYRSELDPNGDGIACEPREDRVSHR